MSIYDQHLDRTPANFVALSPVSFVERTAEVFGDMPAVVHGARRLNWAQVRERAARLAAALRALGIGKGDTVSTLLPNTPEMVEAHYAIPALGAVINTLNTRLDAALLAWQMNHCEAKVLITDREFAPVVAQALAALGRGIVVIDVCDSEYSGPGERLGAHEYEALLAAHAPLPRLDGPADEWDAIAVSYTSGTTGDPKGVVTHHRGAYLNAVSNVVTWTMPRFARYLWTLPMFHCNGWCFPWTLAARAGRFAPAPRHGPVHHAVHFDAAGAARLALAALEQIDTVFGEVEHRFDNDWKLHLGGSTSTTEGEFSGTYLSRYDGPLETTAYQSHHTDKQRAFDGFASGPFEAFGRTHELVVGASNRVYDATTNFAGGALTATGVNGETFAMSGTGDATNLASKNVQTNQALSTLTGLALGTSANGGLSSNYNAISTTGSSASEAARMRPMAAVCG